MTKEEKQRALDNGIEVVSGERIDEVINHRRQNKGKYLAEIFDEGGESCGYVAVDNSTLDAWTEEYRTAEEAIDWLMEESDE